MMRFEIKTAPQMTSWDALLEVWQTADKLEIFDAAWNFDHFEPIMGLPRTGPCFEGWSMLAAMATATERIRLGCMVTGIHHRHPAVLANMAATIDIVSGGRLELGIGAGWNTDESNAYGLPLAPKLGDRFDYFDEACEVIIGLLTNEQFSFEGRHFRITDAYCDPKPIQSPHPPITIGGSGPRRTLRAVARYAQKWNTPRTTPEELAQSLAILAGHAADVGRDVSDITITAQVQHRADAVADTIERARQLEAAGAEIAIITLTAAEYRAPVVTELAAALADSFDR